MDKPVRGVVGGALRPNDPRRFLVEVMIGTMNADGSVDAREQAVLQRHLAEHDLFQGVSETAARTLVELATDALRFAGGAIARIPTIARGLPARIHRITAYAMACEIANADLEISHAELGFLEALRQAVKVGPNEAQEIFNALHEGRLASHLDDRLLRVRGMVPLAVEMFTLRAHALGKVTDDHRFGLRDFLLGIPDLAMSHDEVEGELYRAFRKPRPPGTDVLQELAAIGRSLPDPVDRWWMVVYALAAEAPGAGANWRVIPFAGLLQQGFGLGDPDMDLAAADAQGFPASLPRPR
jgi:uncharacterized tellurite resistance protein B-like protein